MKQNHSSFLFLYSLLLVVCLQNAFAQSTKDSLYYYRALALQPQNASDLFKSQHYFNNSYDKALKRGDIERATNHLYYLASIAYKEGEYIKSEQTAVKALSLLDKMTRSAYTEATRKSFYNLLGLMYSEQKNKPKAIELYNSAFKISKSAADSAKIYNNLSIVYLKFDDIANAEKEILKAYQLLPRIAHTLTQALVLDNYGVIASQLNNANGITLMTRALELRASQKDSSTIYTSYSHLADYYYRINDDEASKAYALKSLQLAESLNSASYKNRALGLLVKLSDDPIARAYKKLNDSLYAAEKESLNQYALLRYDNSEYKRDALESQLEKEKQEFRTLYALLIALFIALASVSLYFILRARHRKEKLQQVFHTESRISKEIHDEIASDVFQVMTRLENKEVKHNVLKNELHNLYLKTRDISKKHSVLNADYPFIEYLEELLESFNDAHTNIIIKGLSEITWDTIPQLKQLTLYRVLQELLINMKKHSSASIVVVIFIKESNGIQVNYSDNGVGTMLKKRNGLQNTENRIQSINGTITFVTYPNKGFKAQITM
ncbi:Sensory box histidine kinase [Winogradskyella psychrotolerans RS-3]|uniref:histidine kinase n=1 Tax=Winogradskyella psychrotolerans RS-3 TaxID=641526 RepID=S7VVT6_9FLAO|nr:sensor histidine kinase [Winogradskyella psychrotolerans]EPR73517.1 Sensory box histidine kinase [Winogradskyella psychrotolerans RS-3]